MPGSCERFGDQGFAAPGYTGEQHTARSLQSEGARCGLEPTSSDAEPILERLEPAHRVEVARVGGDELQDAVFCQQARLGLADVLGDAAGAVLHARARDQALGLRKRQPFGGVGELHDLLVGDRRREPSLPQGRQGAPHHRHHILGRGRVKGPGEREVLERLGHTIVGAGEHHRLTEFGTERELLDPAKHRGIGEGGSEVEQHERAGIRQLADEPECLLRILRSGLRAHAVARQTVGEGPGPHGQVEGLGRGANEAHEAGFVVHPRHHEREREASKRRRSATASIATSSADRVVSVSLDLPNLQTVYLDGPVVYRAWDGPADTTFVMVHGLGGAHINWVRVAPELSGLGRVLALDLPGFGWSPRAGRGSGLMDSRRALSRFISEMGTGHVVLCGNSMGGAVAILQAAVEPGSVEGLVLTCSVFPWTRGGFPHPVIMASFAGYRLPLLGERIVATRMRAMKPEQAVRLGFRFTVADPASIPADVVALHVDLMRERQGDADAIPAFTHAARSLLRLGEHRQAARRALDRLTDDVLVMHGRRDRVVPAAFAEAELRRHPRWRGRIFPDLGHAIMLEAPGRWVAEVADWHAERIR